MVQQTNIQANGLSGLSLTNTMSRHTSYVNQRADKIRVEAAGNVEDYKREDGLVTSGVPKKVEHYTMTCPDCDGVGRYDERGDVICEDCGVVISHKPAVIPTEFNADADDSVGSSRGLEKMGEVYGTHEPR